MDLIDNDVDIYGLGRLGHPDTLAFPGVIPNTSTCLVVFQWELACENGASTLWIST